MIKIQILNLSHPVSQVFIKRLKLCCNFVNPKGALMAEAAVKSLSIVKLLDVCMSILIIIHITNWTKEINLKMITYLYNKI